MLILNDCPEQVLEFDHPSVRVLNYQTPFTDVSVKQNHAISLLCGEWVAYWDDDDIWMPWRLRMSWEFARTMKARAVKQARAWYVENNMIKTRPYNLFFGSALFSRDYYVECGGATRNEPADKTAWTNMMGQCCAAIMDPSPVETYFLYRWGGPGVHDSAPAGLLQNRATNEERHRVFRQRTLASSLFQPGAIRLTPHWKRDYEADVRQAIAAGKGELT